MSFALDTDVPIKNHISTGYLIYIYGIKHISCYWLLKATKLLKIYRVKTTPQNLYFFGNPDVHNIIYLDIYVDGFIYFGPSR